MNKVHVSQFFACSKVSYACELYYICNLGKYLYYNYNEQLSLDGVILTDTLKKSNIWEYFRVALDSGWVCDTSIPKEDYEITLVNPLDTSVEISNRFYTTDYVKFDVDDKRKRAEFTDYNLRTPLKTQISFNTQNDAVWIWDLKGKDGENFAVNNSALNDSLICYNFVSLIAMLR